MRAARHRVTPVPLARSNTLIKRSPLRSQHDCCSAVSSFPVTVGRDGRVGGRSARLEITAGRAVASRACYAVEWPRWRGLLGAPCWARLTRCCRSCERQPTLAWPQHSVLDNGNDGTADHPDAPVRLTATVPCSGHRIAPRQVGVVLSTAPYEASRPRWMRRLFVTTPAPTASTSSCATWWS